MIEALNNIGLVVGLMMLIGAAFAVAKGAFNKSRIEALREDNTDLRNRVADCEKHIGTLEAKDEAHVLTEESLKNENELLKEMLVQRADVETVKEMVTGLIDLLNNHHTESMAEFRAMTRAIKESHNG